MNKRMAADYGHFEDRSSAPNPLNARAVNRRTLQCKLQFGENQLTPSFFCRLDEEVVYWNTSRLSG
jgi:hypothetical protein